MVARRLVQPALVGPLRQMLDQGLLAGDDTLEQVAVAPEPVAERGEAMVELDDGALQGAAF